MVNRQQRSGEARSNESNARESSTPKLKFSGSPPVIKKLTWDAGVCGNWTEKRHGVWTFRLRNGAGMHWSSTRGTVWFDGPQLARDELARVIEAARHRWIYPGAKANKPSYGASRRRRASRSAVQPVA